MTKYTTIRIAAARYEDADDCLGAAADEIARERGLTGYDLSPRWEDDEREAILLDIPDYAVRAGDETVLAGNETDWTADDLVLCESPDGWSLHAPGSSDEDIARGDAPYLVSGPGEPTEADYAAALRELARRGR